MTFKISYRTSKHLKQKKNARFKEKKRNLFNEVKEGLDALKDKRLG